jgi:hypothetical protein
MALASDAIAMRLWGASLFLSRQCDSLLARRASGAPASYDSSQGGRQPGFGFAPTGLLLLDSRAIFGPGIRR